VELNLDDFTRIRFGQDKRLDEVARMLQSSDIPTVRMIERPELRYAYGRNTSKLTARLIHGFFSSEHDQAKEQQNHVLRIAERTLSLPLGRALLRSVPYPQLPAKRMPSRRSSFRSIFSPRTSL
jgi:anaphase-promoting complex subunit 1